jgi:hypothetical protein
MPNKNDKSIKTNWKNNNKNKRQQKKNCKKIPLKKALNLQLLTKLFER